MKNELIQLLTKAKNNLYSNYNREAQLEAIKNIEIAIMKLQNSKIK
jgi:hypothetical protein